MFTITNTNYKAKISTSCNNLYELHKLIPKTKLYYPRPFMLKYREKGITVLLFNKLSVRVMGNGSCHDAVFYNFVRLIPKATIISDLQVMSSTVRLKLPWRINLYKLDPTKFYGELELFPGFMYKHDGTEYINVFESGAVIITGVRQLERLHEIYSMLKCDLVKA